MASTNLPGDVTLTSPSEWDTWDEVFRTKAQINDLWEHIDPSTDGEELLRKPIKPRVSDFPKHIQNSRQESPTPTEQEGGRRRARTRGVQETQTQTDTPEYPPTKEPARSMSDMSPEDLLIFQSLINIYDIDMREYNTQRDRINALQSWITSTVARQYQDMCCKAADPLRVWYKNLIERVKPNAVEEYKDAVEEHKAVWEEHKAVWEEYQRAVKVLVRPPKDPHAWLRNWTVAVEKAATHGIVMTDKPWTWSVSFMKAIRYWKPTWELIYNALYKEEINAGTLSFKTVASDFERELNKESTARRGTVAKGAFGLTYNKVRKDKERTKDKTSSSKKRERATTVHRICIVCERPMCRKLKACYYAFPGNAFEGWAPSAHTQEIADKNLEKKYVQEKLMEIKNKRARTA